MESNNMSIFNTAMFTEEGLEKNTDVLGGFSTLPTGMYKAEIKSNYFDVTSSGAVSLTVIANLTDKNDAVHEYRETYFITNKKKENYFVNSNGKKTMLPGCRIVNDLCLAIAGKSLGNINPEDRTVSVYNFAEKKNTLMNREVIPEIIGGSCYLLITEEIRNKQVKNDMGVYVDINEKVHRNVVTKVLFSNYLTTTEAEKVQQGTTITEPFYKKWLDKNEGKPNNRYKPVAEVNSLGETVADKSAIEDMLR